MLIKEISKQLRRRPSKTSRELNQLKAFYYRGKYIGSQTDIRVKNKWKESHKRENPYLSLRWVQDFIKNNLKYGYSPEIISHLLKKEHGISTFSRENIHIHLFPKKKIVASITKTPKWKTKKKCRKIFLSWNR